MDVTRKSGSTRSSLLGPVLLNRLLWISLIAFLILFVLLVIMRYTKPKLDLGLDSQNRSNSGAMRQEAPPFSSFEGALHSRDLFSLTVQGGQQPTVTALDDIVSNLLITGIVDTGRKEAIVQDKRSRQTYFVSVGSMVGDVEVVEIRQQSILLRRGNETRELFIP